MKFILIISLIFPIFSAAQDSLSKNCKLIREKDPFTKETKLSTGFIPLDGGQVTIDANKLEIDFLFSLDGPLKCFDNNSIALIFFEGTKLKLTARNGGTMNCEGLFHIIFKNSANLPSMLTKMATQKVSHILFKGNNKKEFTVNLSPVDQQLFLTLANCLVEEAKGLLPN